MDARRLFDEKLTNEEANVLNKIATKSGMDCWFFIREKSKFKDVIYDCEEDKELSLFDGIGMLDSGITELDDYGLTAEEKVIYYRLSSRLAHCKLERVADLLYNALVRLEDDYIDIMDTDLADDLGITQEEYDWVMDVPPEIEQ